jgi:isoleucyl-tRNA synthetase
MDNTYMETIWWIFKDLYKRKLAYEGKKILMYCPRCETPIAKAEIAMDNSYKDISEKSLVLKFKLKKRKASILAWTTTPWTLMGNVALAVNPKLTYVEVKIGKENLILLKDRLDVLKDDYKKVKEFKGKELVGLEYQPLYEIKSAGKKHVVVDGGKEVSSEEGTGIVHLALYGEFDYEMIRKYKLSIIQHLDDTGKLILGPEKWMGTYFKELDKLIIKDLEKRNLVYSSFDYTHSYPFCYRCKTTLFYNAVDSWFIDIQKIKPELIKQAENINWYPGFIKEGRFKNILETAPDWTISRNRFWATAIPVWKCECGEMEVIGSIEELQARALEKIPDDVDLHKHVMDEVHLKCSKCQAVMNRVPEVFDCWLESGSMPYAAKHYPFENKDWFKTNYPADFISEYIAQTRAWFYYMHVMGVLLFKKHAFRNVVVTGNIRASDGQKMSKSLKNYPDPHLMFNKFGADTMRFYLMNSLLMRGQDMNFKEEGLKEVYRKVILLLSNVAKFYQLFGKNNKEFNDSSSENILDKWVISRTNTLIQEATSSMDEYNTLKTCEAIIKFIDELSTWYVRRSRKRFKQKDKNAVHTLAYVLNSLIKVMAPITPFITESIYQEFRKANKDLLESVHLEFWPKHDVKLINIKVEDKMSKARKVVSMALDEREKAKIPVRQPLNNLTIKGLNFTKEYLNIIKDELNIKNIELEEGKEVSVELDTQLTDELLREGVARDLIRKLNNYRKELKLTIKDRITLYFNTSDSMINQAFKEHKKKIMESVQADKVKFEKHSKSKDVKINNSIVTVGIKLV